VKARPLALLLGILLLGTAMLAGCAQGVQGSGRLAKPTGTSTSTPPKSSTTCPAIVDREARLSYNCVDDSLTKSAYISDPLFEDGGVLLDVETEPSWLAAQRSAQLSSTKGGAKALALSIGKELSVSNYGDDPTSKIVSQAAIAGLGTDAYRLDQLITLDSAYARQRGLLARSEMLSVVVVAIGDGKYSALTITVPDTEKAWWTRYDAVVASLKII
jgi:hypothetical protein